jgi:hypothetical protein
MGLSGVGWGGRAWTDLALDRNRRGDLENVVMTSGFHVPVHAEHGGGGEGGT